MVQLEKFSQASVSGLDMAELLALLAEHSTRPRYTFMVLNLLAQAARPDGSAGPLVASNGELVLLRDWLCDALAPMADRDPRRRALFDRTRADLKRRAALPACDDDARAMVTQEARARMRTSGKTAISRAVSELVAAGLMRRHYQGYAVNHENRGAQRQAVYTLARPVWALLGRSAPPSPAVRSRQAAFTF